MGEIPCWPWIEPYAGLSKAIAELNPVLCQLEDFNSFCTPLTGAVLLSSNADFLSSTQALHGAFMALAHRHTVAKYDSCMGDLDPPQRVIWPLDVNPSADQRMSAWRVDDTSLESSINCPVRGIQTGQQNHDGSN